MMRDFIDEIKSIDLREASSYEVLLEKFKSVDQLHFPSITLAPSDNISVVRARQLDTENDYFEKVSDHSYNPDPKLVRQGRSNKPGDILFYARSDFAGALVECQFMSGKNNGERVSFSFSEWKLTKALQFITIFNPSDITLISKTGRTPYVALFEKHYHDLSEKGDTAYWPFFEFIANRFMAAVAPHERHRYKLTTAYASMLLERYPDLGGIIYQSVIAKTRYNFVIQKKYIDEGHFTPFRFSKGTYMIQNEGVDEVSFVKAKGFDQHRGLISW